MRFIRLLAVLLLSASGAALAQKAAPEPIKFGQPDPQDLTPTPFAQDSAAPAVVLCDYGTTRFEGRGAGLRLVFERTTRLKILKKAGYEWASVSVPLYHRDGNSEELSRLRGFTYNLEAGKVRKTPLAEASTFSEEQSKNVRVRKFTLPDVREGSVIEYSYIIRSDFLFNLQDWTFQRDIPTRWSEYRTTIPGFYRYKIIQQTNQPFTAFTERIVSVSLGVEQRAGDGLAAGISAGQTTVTSSAVESRWVMQNLAAFRPEPFITTPADYVVRVHFELAGVQWGENEPFKDLSNTWPKINQELLSDENFGLQLSRGDFLKPQMQALAAQHADPAQRAAAVREAVMQSVRYNGEDYFKTMTPASLKRAFEAHRGTSADVNLLLLAALRQAGLPAQPVLLSTRDHGHVSRDFPLLDKFNYVVALLPLEGGRELLIDATEPLLPCGVLPERCLNRTGRLIAPAPAEGRWVDLTPTQRHVYFQQVQLALAPDGAVSGQVHEEHSGYAAADERAKLTQLGEKKYLAQRTAAHAGGTVPTAAVGAREDLSKPLQVNYAFLQPAEDGARAEQLYFSPFAALGLERNPFVHAERRLPVDFGAARDETRLLTLTLPAGYELAELPKGLIVNLPDEGGRLQFTVTGTGAAVQLASRLNLRKAVYSPAEYAHLRDLYRRLLEKQAEKLVIRKKA